MLPILALRRLGATFITLSSALSVSAPPAAAQLPLSIEELLVEEARLTGTVTTALATRREPVLAGTPSTPVLAWREVTRERVALGLRYGVSARLEVNASAERARERWEVGSLARGRSRAERLALGLNWLALAGSAGTLLFDLQVDAVADLPGGDRRLAAAAGSLGATWYRALDPVVLSLAARYRGGRDRDRQGLRLSPGRQLSVDGSVNFAVNPTVTLFGGLSLQRRSPDRLAGRAVSGTRTGQAVSLGLGYAPAAGTTLFVRGRLPGSGAGAGSSATVELLYEF